MTSSTQSRCVYCGDAPVNHGVHFVNTSIDLVFAQVFPGPIIRSLSLQKLNESRFVRVIAHWLLSALAIVGVIRFSDDTETAHTHRTKVVWKEAEKRGIRMQQLMILGQARDEMRALLPVSRGSKRYAWEYFQSLPVPPWIAQDTNTWVDDKRLFKKEFRAKDLPVTHGHAVMSRADALRIFSELEKPVIAKPREGSRARHTTVGITTEDELLTAFNRAQQLCPFVMIEEFVTGTLYRATCVNGVLIGVVEFVKPATVADGVHTCEELRVLHNTNKKFPTLTDVKDDAWFQDAIRHQGFAPDSIPPAGIRLLLSEHSERPNGGYFIDITDEIPADTRATIERAAVVCSTPIIGFDIISEDLRDKTKRFTFIEGNSLPYIELHHIPFAGSVRDVAGAVWDMWELEHKD